MHTRPIALLLLLLVIPATVCRSARAAHGWRDASGKFLGEGEFLEIAGGVVVVRGKNEQLLSFHLRRLRADDRRRAESLQKEFYALRRRLLSFGRSSLGKKVVDGASSAFVKDAFKQSGALPIAGLYEMSMPHHTAIVEQHDGDMLVILHQNAPQDFVTRDALNLLARSKTGTITAYRPRFGKIDPDAPPDESKRRDQKDLNRKVVAFAQRMLKKKVGRGECSDLADEALAAASAMAAKQYEWGKRIDLAESVAGDILQFAKISFERAPIFGRRIEPRRIRPGDVIYFKQAKIVRKDGSWKQFSNVPSIVAGASAMGLSVFYQSVSKKKVLALPFELSELTRESKIQAFRPVPTDSKR